MCIDIKYCYLFGRWCDLVYLFFLEEVRWSFFGIEVRWFVLCVVFEWVYRFELVYLLLLDVLYCFIFIE